MARSIRKQGKTRGTEVAGCCGQVCDQRCWQSSIRDHQHDRRLSTVGGVRLS